MNLEATKNKDNIIDRTINYFDEKITKSTARKIVAKIQGLNGSVLLALGTYKGIDGIIHPKIEEEIDKKLPDTSVLTKIVEPLKAIRLLHILNALEHLVASIKSAKEIIVKKGTEKLDAVLSTLSSATQTVGDISTFIDGLKVVSTAVKVAKVAEPIFSGFSLAGSVISLGKTIRSWQKSDECAKEMEALDYFMKTLDSMGNSEKQHSNTQYKAIYAFLTDKEKLKNFDLRDAEKFEKFIKENFNQTEEMESGQVDEVKLEKLKGIKDELKGRLKTNKATYVISIISDVINIASNILAIASIACPPLAIISLCFSLVTSLGKHIYTSVRDYTFEDRFGLIQRTDEEKKNLETTMGRVKDFAKWYFTPLAEAFVELYKGIVELGSYLIESAKHIGENSSNEASKDIELQDMEHMPLNAVKENKKKTSSKPLQDIELQEMNHMPPKLELRYN